MDADRLLFGVFMAVIGALTGYFTGRRHNEEEISTLRSIVQDNQKQNLERMEKARGKERDKAQ